MVLHLWDFRATVAEKMEVPAEQENVAPRYLHIHRMFCRQMIGVGVMFLNRWARKGLQNGDLSALRELSDPARWDDPNPARTERLKRRGFVAVRTGEKARITAKGRVALLF
jgi:hypothetical protein